MTDLSQWCLTEENPLRPYDKELLELLLVLEAAEKSEDRGWDDIARKKQAGKENHRGKDNLRGEGMHMFNDVEWEASKEDIEIWPPQQQMLSNQVMCLYSYCFPPYCHTN